MPVNYRPVSLLPIISHILEHFVKKQLVKYLTAHELYPKTQLVYRKCHSTEDALVLAAKGGCLHAHIAASRASSW